KVRQSRPLPSKPLKFKDSIVSGQQASESDLPVPAKAPEAAAASLVAGFSLACSLHEGEESGTAEAAQSRHERTPQCRSGRRRRLRPRMDDVSPGRARVGARAAAGDLR